MAALIIEQLECLLDCILPSTIRTLNVFPANCTPLHRDYSTGMLSVPLQHRMQPGAAAASEHR